MAGCSTANSHKRTLLLLACLLACLPACWAIFFWRRGDPLQDDPVLASVMGGRVDVEGWQGVDSPLPGIYLATKEREIAMLKGRRDRLSVGFLSFLPRVRWRRRERMAG